MVTIFQCLILRIGGPTYMKYGKEIGPLLSFPMRVSKFKLVDSFRHWITWKPKWGHILLYSTTCEIGRRWVNCRSQNEISLSSLKVKSECVKDDGSKIEAKFRNFMTPVKYRERVGEMSAWILQV